ncbi:MAG: hypothetical protein QG603_262 [Patescibacteria group bacterium]|nr:hypothetical protein [Patescibacteria group bacterium]
MNTCLSLRRTKMDRRYRNILFRNEARNIRARSRVFFVCKKISPPLDCCPCGGGECVKTDYSAFNLMAALISALVQDSNSLNQRTTWRW